MNWPFLLLETERDGTEQSRSACNRLTFDRFEWLNFRAFSGSVSQMLEGLRGLKYLRFGLTKSLSDPGPTRVEYANRRGEWNETSLTKELVLVGPSRRL